MDELDAYEAEIHRCGHHKSQTEDPDAVWGIGESECRACAAGAGYRRILQARDEAALKKRGEDTFPGAPLPSDGKSFWVKQLHGQEAEDARRRAAEQQRRVAPGRPPVQVDPPA